MKLKDIPLFERVNADTGKVNWTGIDKMLGKRKRHYVDAKWTCDCWVCLQLKAIEETK